MDTVFTAKAPDAGLKSLSVTGRLGELPRQYRERFGSAEGVEYRITVEGDGHDDGMSPTLEVRSGNGLREVAVDAEGRGRAEPVFFETRYHLLGEFANDVKNVKVEHRVAAIADAFEYSDRLHLLFGDIDFINTPGLFRLPLRIELEDGNIRRVAIEFTVVSVKMDVVRHQKAILGEIEQARQGVIESFLAKTFGDSGFEPNEDAGGNDPTWYAILESVFGYYREACRKIIHDPHRKYSPVVEYRVADRVKSWNPAMTNRFFAMPEDRRETARFRVERLEAAEDTPENRFVLHTLCAISKRLRDFGESYRGKGVSDACIAGIREKAYELERLAVDPFFRRVGRFEGFRQQSLVLQKRPGYAQVLTAWIKLKMALSPLGEGVELGYRPISALFEFWAFLQVKAVLDARFGEGVADPAPSDIAGLLEHGELDTSGKRKTLSKMGYRYEKDGIECRVYYQMTYGTAVESETFTHDYEQRPDIVLTLRESKDGTQFTYLFDAKYRIGEKDGLDASPRDAIDDMHRYRDAILYRGRIHNLHREVIGAYILFPGRVDKSYPYAEMRREENIGAIPLLPGETKALEEFIDEILTKRGKYGHLQSAIPPRGASLWLDESGIGGNDMIVVDVAQSRITRGSITYFENFRDGAGYFWLDEKIAKGKLGLDEERAKGKRMAIVTRPDGDPLCLRLTGLIRTDATKEEINMYARQVNDLPEGTTYLVWTKDR